MHSQDQRHPPLPSRLTSAEREFYLELRRLVDVSRLSAGDLGGTPSGEMAWKGWLNGQSLPPQRAIRELASKLAENGVDAGQLANLWARAVLPTPYPAEPGRSPVRPRQLPVETGNFMGRAEELKILVDRARQVAATGDAGSGTETGGGSATVIVLEGPAGIGKTALTNHVAHQVSDLFPDGQLWVGLRGSGDADEPATDEKALRGFLEAFGVAPRELPREADEQAAMYRNLLTGRRVLVILDNARDVGQVRQLLPASGGCLVLITTRTLTSDLTDTAAHVLRLGPLSESDARGLLERRLGATRLQLEPSAVADLGSLCGRLPLALSVAAALAVADPDLPLRALADELRSGGHAPDDPAVTARTVFAASYAHLSDGAARMFRLFSLCCGPDIGLPATTSLAAIPAAEARMVLDELTAMYLVEEHQPGRFTVHDLLRAYAADQARANESAAELDAATRRLLDHYLRGMHAATALIYPDRYPVPLVPPVAGVQTESFSSPAQALAWCRAERPVAQSLVAHAARDGHFGAYCWQLPAVMAPLLVRGGFAHDDLAMQRVAITAAAGLGDPLGQGIANYEYAHACALVGEVGDSDAHLKAALELFTRAGDRAGAARALNGMTQLLIQDGEYLRALDREKEALELRRNVGDPNGIAHSEQTMGFIYARLGRHDEAVRHCQHSLDLSRETGSRALAADALAILGSVHLSLGDYAKAAACYTEVLVIYRAIGDNVSTAEALTGLGDAQHATGDVRAARAAWRQALAILSDLPNADPQPVKARLARFA